MQIFDKEKRMNTDWDKIITKIRRNNASDSCIVELDGDIHR